MKIILFIIVMAFGFAGQLFAQSPSCNENQTNPMIILIDTINNECDTGIRTKYAEQLFDLIKKADKNNIDNIVISKVTALLADRDDSVRYWAAAGLGILGPKAIQSVPALQKALDEIKGSTGSKTSASAIRLALERISKNGLSDQPVKAGTK